MRACGEAVACCTRRRCCGTRTRWCCCRIAWPLQCPLQLPRVMSFNVRMDTDKDGDNRWDCRKECVADVIRSQAPLVVGLQEPHKHQVTWLAEALASTHGCCKGKGRSPVVFGKGEEVMSGRAATQRRSQHHTSSRASLAVSVLHSTASTTRSSTTPRGCSCSRPARSG